MKIRQATLGDVKALAPLIFSSAPSALAAIFDINDELSASHFLHSSLSTEDGQYGFANHWLVEIDHQVAGCISAWHSHLPDSFHQATLHKLTGFYGIAHALSVVQSSQTLQDCFPKPQEHEWCIGHFAVSTEHQRKGVGTALLDFMHKQALSCGKSELCLDVESINTQAIGFYLGHGFVKKQESGVSSRMQTLGISSHFHLNKLI
ncbi:GNAT family N-acetyltransferase [uncultured Paraglaciecola sp.]|jgi:ribosomal protein S18 acetylase RimI-like enzyme|uniref:GNAT family N-acetyltransferase n=1 Tax=uncultured Paraglaciecola sp. TaxID=1765024 RepID=UPI0025CD6708|nr:GNAT family N-acetyltransferase [uncultured Paraglaciecola sp.]